jgi:hypothetical protein
LTVGVAVEVTDKRVDVGSTAGRGLGLGEGGKPTNPVTTETGGSADRTGVGVAVGSRCATTGRTPPARNTPAHTRLAHASRTPTVGNHLPVDERSFG